MSDSFFIGTVAKVQDVTRFGSPEALKKALSKLKNPSDLDAESIATYLKEVVELEKRLKSQTVPISKHREIGMMVSLDHTIYFHNRNFKADEWIFTEMSSPWADDGRGLVMQKMWSMDGTLIATCVQEVSYSIGPSCHMFNARRQVKGRKTQNGRIFNSETNPQYAK
jgi:hypothetical protein